MRTIFDSFYQFEKLDPCFHTKTLMSLPEYLNQESKRALVAI
jgi:hypothetical protein